MQLFFVQPTSGTQTQRQKELSYAAAQAHLSRRGHETRRQRDKHKGQSVRGGLKRQRKLPSKGKSTSIQAEASIVQADASSVTKPSLPILGGLQGIPPSSGTIQIEEDPQLIFFHGNSDPFDTQLVHVSPRVNFAVSFVRFHLSRSCAPPFMQRLINTNMHSYNPVDYEKMTGLAVANFLWSLFNQNQGVFWSAVASIIPLLRRVATKKEEVEELDDMVLQCKNTGLEWLRNEVKNLDTKPVTMCLMYHVKALFREASTAGDLETARAHANMLSWLVMKIPNRTSGHLRIALFSDAIPALFQLRRPIFDQKSWMPHILMRIWENADLILPKMEQIEIPECILDQRLRDAFLFVRQALLLKFNNVRTNKRIKSAELVFQWISTKVEYHMCCLLELYFDLLEDGSQATPGERWTEAALALALLYTLQKSFHQLARSDGFDFHESADVIHPAMLEIMKDIKTLCSRSERIFFRHAHFWIIFVGAYCEERMKIGQAVSRFDSSRVWFQRELLVEARHLKVNTWREAKSILSCFVVNDILKPYPETWYPQFIESDHAPVHQEVWYPPFGQSGNREPVSPSFWVG